MIKKTRRGARDTLLIVPRSLFNGGKTVVQGIDGILSPVIRGNGKVVAETSKGLVDNFRAIRQPGLKENSWYNNKEGDKWYNKLYKLPLNLILSPFRTVGTLGLGIAKVADNTLLKPIENTGQVISLGSHDLVNVLRDPFNQSMDKKPIDNFKFSKSNFEEEAYLKEELARLEEQNKILAARKAVLEKSLTNKKHAQEIYNKHNQDELELKKADITNDIKQQQTLTQMQEENKKLLEEISALNKAKSDVKMKKHENKIEKKKLSIDEDISKKQQQYKLEEKELELEERKTFKLLYDKLTLYRASLSQFTKIKAQIPQYKIKYGQNFSDAKFNIDDFENYLNNNLPLLRDNFDRVDRYLSITTEDTSQKISYLVKELSSFQRDFEPYEKYLATMKACMPVVDVNFKESFDKIQGWFKNNIRIKRK